MNPLPEILSRSESASSIPPDSPRRSEAGDTLIEVLMTLVVASLCAVAFLVAFSTSISASAEHRTMASMDTVLRSVSEQAISQIQLQANPLFTPCATPTTYNGLNFGVPTGYSTILTSVMYWNGTSFSSTCTAGSTSPQLIDLTVTGPLGTTSSISFAVDDTRYTGSAGMDTASKLAFTTQPVGGTQGVSLSTQPTITVEDSSGNPVTSDASTVTLVITSGTGTIGATISGCSQAESQGVITLSGCTVNDSGTGYTLTATDGTLTAVSSQFTVDQ